MRCSVCKIPKRDSHAQWQPTTQRTPLTRVQVVFKLYDLTKTEFESGFLCVGCFDLVIQIESLEHQLKSLVQQTEDDMDHHDIKILETSTALDTTNEVNMSPSLEVLGPLRYDKNEDQERSTNGTLGEEQNAECDAKGLRHFPEMILDGAVIKQEELALDEDPLPINIKLSRQRKSPPFKPRIFNTHPDNLDFDISTGKTNNQRDALIYQGYKFYQEAWRSRRHETNQTMDIWRCRNRRCRGRIISYMNVQCVLKDTLVEHCHPPNPEQVLLYEEFQEQIRQIVFEHPDMPPENVFTSAQMLCPNIVVDKTDNMMRNIRRLKKNRREELDATQNHLVTVNLNPS
ncbi:hypothetical protein TCAL_10083 [Tigriopus californicus]|uniref:FLYWCH-type domain-containing protein n=1 Tax=Tigriopus californicus TaxID=6832 RepID=A0A553PC47_TIGCA|nr:uncharacterized protein LOC131876975 [Tigriopus californicus]XP_059078504.1 uncharacterized protein LOC131876975 [Tigriopus californicus]TRY75254.1 hypothetical protein TCAL_10083 [Tigriopus californicus]